MATDTHMDAATGRAGTSRPVLLAGIVAGTAVTVLAMWNGARLRVPDLGPVLGAALGALIVWVLSMAVAAVLSELAVRHHRAAIRHGWRYGKRGGRAARRHAGAAYRGAASRTHPWRARLLAAIQARWAARGSEPHLFRREKASRRIDGKPETEADERFFDLRESGYTGPIDQDGNIPFPAGPDTARSLELLDALHRQGDARATGGGHITPSTEGNTMTEPAGPAAPRGGHRVLTIGTVPGEWKALVAITADFEPEDDAELLAWMAAEVNGMSAYAEALTEVYETGISSVGLDPVSLAALHDTADAAADAAQAMATARQKFAAHYAEVREFAAAGGLLPHDGRWITGDGE
jgi:hypothetical protein